MSIEKAKQHSTAEEQESIVPENITEVPLWAEDVNGTPKFWGTHWQCDLCDAISGSGPQDIHHKDACPNAGTEVIG
jgi:hypothetical protein